MCEYELEDYGALSDSDKVGLRPSGFGDTDSALGRALLTERGRCSLSMAPSLTYL